MNIEVGSLRESRLFRSLTTRQNLKAILGLLALCTVCVALITVMANNESRLKRYTHELTVLRSALEKSSQEIKLRFKRTTKDTSASHKIEKRDNNELIVNPYGVTYIRWGRRDCRRGSRMTHLVYTGYAAGTHYTHTGGGSNYICLHNNVSYSPGRFVDGNQGSSHLYGVEYRDGAWMNPLFDLSDTEASGVLYHSMPCAVCMAEARINQIMIPGRETCPSGWRKEYSGYIMAGSHGDKHPSEFICVDERPQVVAGTSGDQKGSFVLMVETQCPSLLCEPFVAGRELRCVVCTI